MKPNLKNFNFRVEEEEEEEEVAFETAQYQNLGVKPVALSSKTDFENENQFTTPLAKLKTEVVLEPEFSASSYDADYAKLKKKIW